MFTRAVETGADGEKVVAVTTNCDSPDMLLLARKNDVGYWSYAAWSEHDTDRRTWSAEITRRMLQDGHVATGYAADVLGVCAAMTAASNHRQGNWKHGPHVLTGGVAQIRGLRLLQSMAGGSADWWTTLGGYPIPADVNDLLCERFNDAARVYEKLPKPPWRDDVAWGPQDVAGHAVTYNDKPMFVGEQSDLLWRALTETDHHGMSPLKAGFSVASASLVDREMGVAAALYDETAAEQLTTGLFDGVDPTLRQPLQTQARVAFESELCRAVAPQRRWTKDQQTKLRGFIDIIEALNIG